jgi:hypothetical protein
VRIVEVKSIRGTDENRTRSREYLEMARGIEKN